MSDQPYFDNPWRQAAAPRVLDDDAVRAFYSRAIAPHVATIEQARLRAVSSFVWRAGFGLLLGGAAVGFVLVTPAWLTLYLTYGNTLLAALALVVIGLSIFICRPLVLFKENTKGALMNLIVGAFPGFSYEPRLQIPPVLLLQSHLFGLYDQDKGGDTIIGTYNGVKVLSANVHLTREERTAKGQKREVTVFHGVVYHCDFPRRFQGETRVRQDGGWLGNAFGSVFGNSERIRLEDPRFENIFEVYSTDQIEARYILTTGFMELLLRVAARHKNRIEVAFFNQSMLVKAWGQTARLSLSNPLRRIDWLTETTRLINEFQDVLRLVDELKLNQRIGL